MYGNYGIDRLVSFVESLARQADESDEYPHNAPTLSNETLAEMAQDVLKTFYANFQMPSKGNGDRCPICGHKDGYNGWSNYETWEVALELSNSRGDNEYCESIVRDAGSVYDGAKELEERYSGIVDEYLEAHGIKGGISDIPFSSLYTASWNELNWCEIAASFKPDEWGDADSAPEYDEDEDTDE